MTPSDTTATVTPSGTGAHDAVTAAARLVHEHLLDGGDRSFELRRIRAAVEQHAPLLSTSQVDSAVRKVEELLHGLGPLEPLLADPSIDEIMVNGPGAVWIERNGAVGPSDVVVDQSTIRAVIDRVVGPLGLRVDRTAPFVDARLADGSRVNVAVPPLAIDGPYVTIRRFRRRPFELGDFCDDHVAAELAAAVRDRCSIVVSGGTGSGKTSFLNALARHLPAAERVITIEDAAELRLPGEHILRLEARPSNAEGVGEITIRALVRNALRMRPDRLVIGEVRGDEAFDLIQAMNTGHAGSMSTCHANSPLDALRRIEVMAMTGEHRLPVELLREQLEAAVDLVVHVERDDGGARRVAAIHRCRAAGE